MDDMRDAGSNAFDNHPKWKDKVSTKKAWEMYLEGYSQQKIADLIGISQSALSLRFKRAGLT
jgi:DNA-binding transcriptional regulator LsrR (DeoR family)